MSFCCDRLLFASTDNKQQHKNAKSLVNSMEIAATERKKALHVVQYLYDYYIIPLINMMIVAFPGALFWCAGINSDDWAHPAKQMNS